MPESPTVWLPVVLALFAFLFRSVSNRYREEEKRLLANRPKLTAADVSSLTRKIQHLRENPTAALKSIPHQTCRRSRLIAAARSVIAHFSFFNRDREA